ncbi:MAG TPA: class I SAM-dependent methyltransferase [Streptosporangiaceae bacterium]
MSSGNAEQIEYWSGSGGESWAERAPRMERELAGFGELAIRALAPADGWTVLDVGCGTGATTIELAQRVAPHGRVVGVDLSGTLLGTARKAAASRGAANVTFVQADAQDLPADHEFDGLYSRFGVMFFADPAAAFARLRGCVRPGGALAFACWQGKAANPWFTAAAAAAAGLAGVTGAPAGPGAPGPFALADAAQIRQILAAAGWSNVRVSAEHDELVLDDTAIAERADFAVRRGPAAQVLAGEPQAARQAAAQRVTDAFLAFSRDGQVRVPRAVWIVSARG